MVTLLVAAGVGEDFLGGKKRKTVQKGLVDGSTVHYNYSGLFYCTSCNKIITDIIINYNVMSCLRVNGCGQHKTVNKIPQTTTKAAPPLLQLPSCPLSPLLVDGVEVEEKQSNEEEDDRRSTDQQL